MTKGELSQYRSALETEQAELVHLVRNREGIAIEKSPDALDEVQGAAERELAIRNLDRDSNMLRQIRRALARITASSSGLTPTKWSTTGRPSMASAAAAARMIGSVSRPVTSAPTWARW